MHLPRFTSLLQYRADVLPWQAPSYRAAAPASLAPKYGIEAQYARIRNVLRQFNAASLVRMALETLWRDTQALEAIPWNTLLLIKWSLQDHAVALRLGPDMPGPVFDDLRHSVWAMHGKSGHTTAPRAVLRSILTAQLGFQKPGLWGFLRWPALIARLEPGHRCRQQFRSVFRMEPDDFMDLAFAVQDIAVSDVASVGPQYLAPLRQCYGDSVQIVVDLLSRDMPALRSELRSAAAQVVSGRGELREFPYLQRFPLLRDGTGALHCWHPMLLTRGLEEAVHLRLSPLGSAYTQAFSPVFERYVLELLRDAAPPVLIEEQQYWAACGRDASAVDAIWREGGATILVEAKLALFGDAVLVADTPRAIKDRLKRVMDAITQGWRVALALSKPEHPLFDPLALDFYHVIVVNRELYLSSGEALSHLVDQHAPVPENPDMLRWLPLNRILIVSIEDFEHAMGCVRSGEVGLPALLREAAHDNGEPTRARLFLADHLRRYTQSFTTPRLLAQARDACAARLAAVLPDDVDPGEDHPGPRG